MRRPQLRKPCWRPPTRTRRDGSGAARLASGDEFWLLLLASPPRSRSRSRSWSWACPAGTVTVSLVATMIVLATATTPWAITTGGAVTSHGAVSAASPSTGPASHCDQQRHRERPGAPSESDGLEKKGTRPTCPDITPRANCKNPRAHPGCTVPPQCWSLRFRREGSCFRMVRWVERVPVRASRAAGEQGQ